MRKCFQILKMINHRIVVSLMNTKGELYMTSEKVLKTNITKEEGYLYFVDKDGDISRCKAARGRGDKKK